MSVKANRNCGAENPSSVYVNDVLLNLEVIFNACWKFVLHLICSLGWLMQKRAHSLLFHTPYSVAGLTEVESLVSAIDLNMCVLTPNSYVES